MNQYARLEALIGNEKLTLLQNKKVAIIGCGAVGSFALEPIARCGIKHITVVDFDCFEISNLNRQLLATHQTIGRKKVDVAKERILSINPLCDVTTLDLFVNEENVHSIVKDMDVVLDCIDSVNSKIALLKCCYENRIKVISSMGAALKTDITKVQIGDISKTIGCPLAKKVRLGLKKLGIKKGIETIFSTEQADRTHAPSSSYLGSMPTLTATFGLFVAHQGVKYLINKV